METLKYQYLTMIFKFLHINTSYMEYSEKLLRKGDSVEKPSTKDFIVIVENYPNFVAKLLVYLHQ